MKALNIVIRQTISEAVEQLEHPSKNVHYTEDRQHQRCPFAVEQAQRRFAEGIPNADKLRDDVTHFGLSGVLPDTER